jgi:hypothetical protein
VGSADGSTRRATRAGDAAAGMTLERRPYEVAFENWKADARQAAARSRPTATSTRRRRSREQAAARELGDAPRPSDRRRPVRLRREGIPAALRGRHADDHARGPSALKASTRCPMAPGAT